MPHPIYICLHIYTCMGIICAVEVVSKELRNCMAVLYLMTLFV